MPILIVLFIIPLALWNALPVRWQPSVNLGLIGLGVIAIACLAVRIARTQASYRTDPMHGARDWAPSQDAPAYRAHVSLFLRQRGWRISSADTPDAHHVVLRISKEKFRAVLLFLKPPAPSNTATDMLDTATRDFGATRAAIVSAGGSGERIRMTGPTTLFFLSFADLEHLDEIFGTR